MNKDTRFKKGMIPWNKKIPLSKTCPKCNKTFYVKPSLSRVMHCSISCAFKGRTSPMKGKTLSEETRLKIGFAHLTWRKNNPGQLHWNEYKDKGLLKKSEKKHLDGRYREWMFLVKNRDNWECKINNADCSGRLEAHHILNWVEYPELRYDINNGITLCHFHHPHGRKAEEEMRDILKEMVAGKAQ